MQRVIKALVIILIGFSFSCLSCTYRPSRLDLARAKYLNSPDVGLKYKNIVRAHQVYRGMSDVQVLYSWGLPSEVHKTVGSWGVHEQWVYGNSAHHHYLYIENGRLTSWQN